MATLVSAKMVKNTVKIIQKNSLHLKKKKEKKKKKKKKKKISTKKKKKKKKRYKQKYRCNLDAKLAEN